MQAGTPTKRLEALGEALGLFVFVMFFIWKAQLFHPQLAVVIPVFTVATHAARGETVQRLGFGWKDFRRALPLLFWTVIGGCLILAAATMAGTIRQITVGYAAGGLGAYMIWGLFQQYLLNAFIANRLAESAANPKGPLVPLIAATLFSLVHLPNWFLMPVTFVGGYASVRVYQRYRSLYALGIAHALIAFSLFLAVPDSISGHFLIGPRYVLEHYWTYPEVLL